ncbi:MAG: PP2C family serine/threonine-protein phosphatase [Gammaproteobacteria bacterium]
MNGRLSATSSSCTDVGTVREINEDSCLDLPDLGIWAVADGMGGHEAGDVASRMIVDTLAEVGEHRCLSEFVDDVEQRLLDVNDQLASMARDAVMGSTVAVLLCHNHQGAFMWAGDSRVYRLRGGDLRLLTRDHSEVEDLIASGEIDRSQAEEHPSSNVITRAIGALEGESIDVRFQDLRAGDRYLLCSDGLYRVMQDEDLAALMGGGDVHHVCQDLVQTALERGTRDNVTVVMVEFLD